MPYYEIDYRSGGVGFVFVIKAGDQAEAEAIIKALPAQVEIIVGDRPMVLCFYPDRIEASPRLVPEGTMTSEFVPFREIPVGWTFHDRTGVRYRRIMEWLTPLFGMFNAEEVARPGHRRYFFDSQEFVLEVPHEPTTEL